MLYRILLVCLFPCISLAASIQSIPELAQRELPHAEIGVSILDAQTGKLLYNYRGNDYFRPASSLKIFTAAAALYYLTPNYRFPTTISVPPKSIVAGVEQGSVYFNFSGDPSFRTTDLKTMITDIRTQGIHRINQNVILNISKFSGDNYGEGWAADTINWYYSAPVTAATLNENFIQLGIKPNLHPGTITPAYVGFNNGRFFSINNQMHVPTAQDIARGCSFSLNMTENNQLNLAGCWPASRSGSSLSIAVKNPPLMIAHLISQMLANEGITVEGQVIIHHSSQNIPNDQVIIVEHESAPLSILVKRLLKISDDFYAECILKTLGAGYFHQGDFQHGVLAMTTILHEKTGVDFSQSKLSDGSGQSYHDSVSPEQIAKLLYALQSASFYKLFYNSLPISGHDGTLMYRLSNKSLAGKIHAKTGTLPIGGVSSLSGYVRTASGKPLIFSIVINNLPSKAVHGARHFEDKVVELLYKNGI